MKVIKKDGTLEEFDGEKIVNAVNKSASRVMITLDDTAFHEIVGAVLEVIEEKGLTDIPVAVMHNIVETLYGNTDSVKMVMLSTICWQLTRFLLNIWMQSVLPLRSYQLSISKVSQRKWKKPLTKS